MSMKLFHLAKHFKVSVKNPGSCDVKKIHLSDLLFNEDLFNLSSIINLWKLYRSFGWKMREELTDNF